jgi:hypothetical protein
VYRVWYIRIFLMDDVVTSLKSRIALFKLEHSWVWDADKDTVQAKGVTGRDAPERKALERTGDAQTLWQDSMGC